ncbi:MAG: radical SAM family heme chaperone HemW, partial [Dehalococcoidales bacterium]|nr:radical SAM family heme chaperone HemW [Dehalococcoidales bacterium]
FVSYAGRQNDIEQYCQVLIKEIRRRVGKRLVKCVYFGGGTPSLIPIRCIENLMEKILSISQSLDIEVSLEANPGTIGVQHLKELRRIGVNRLSIGAQSLDNRDLELMGRLHNSAAVIEAMKSARSARFDNINLDLIYGIPGQSISSWKQTLEGAIDLEPEHLSLYGLSLESGTEMMNLIECGALPQINPDDSADQYEFAEEILAGKGYHHYEISNWAKAGYECIHNLVYWKHEEYIGVGAGACSYLGGHRFSNTPSLDKYLTSFTEEGGEVTESDEPINPELAAAEAAILSLRLDEGINIEKYNQDYNTNLISVYNKQIDELESYGLLENDGVNIKLTPKGRLLGNEVFWRFLPEAIE